MGTADAGTGRRQARATAASKPGTAARATLGSMLLHTVLGVALWQLERLSAKDDLSEPAIPSIELRAVPDVFAPRPTTAAMPSPELTPPVATPPEPATTEPAAVDPAVDTEAIAPPSDAIDTDAPAQAEANAAPNEVADAGETTDAPDPQAPPAATADELRADVAPNSEERLEAARRAAVARIAATLEAEAAQRDFSADPTADSADDDEAETVNIFEAADELRRRNGGLLTHGRTRSRIGERVSQLCNDLTGGFSFFGIVNVCADPPARADLFGHLRPEYMESLPLCTAEEELDIDVEETAGGAIAAFKCVLVPRAERAAFFGQYDPDLAGWLPAESEAGADEAP